jgi:uncharacterized protein YqjF (DUF2071 family)
MWESCGRLGSYAVEKLLNLCGNPPLLKAAWRSVAIVNYEVDPRKLAPFVPRGTTLDSFGGKTYVSLVGFLFQEVSVLGLPLYRSFEEVNHRFYVRMEDARGLLRGVCFLRELVPRWEVAFGARTLYNEKYVKASMSHSVGEDVSYSWTLGEEEGEVALGSLGPFDESRPGSEEEFITEHYFGYGVARDGSTLEYRVAHPRWRVAPAGAVRVRGSYGADWLGAPVSGYLAEGSDVRVFWSRTLPEASAILAK